MPKSTFTARYRLLRELLREARKSGGLTQPELARRLRRPKSFPAKIELGDRRLDVVELIEYTEALGVDAVKILKKLKKISN